MGRTCTSSSSGRAAIVDFECQHKICQKYVLSKKTQTINSYPCFLSERLIYAFYSYTGCCFHFHVTWCICLEKAPLDRATRKVNVPSAILASFSNRSRSRNRRTAARKKWSGRIIRDYQIGLCWHFLSLWPTSSMAPWHTSKVSAQRSVVQQEMFNVFAFVYDLLADHQPIAVI